MKNILIVVIGSVGNEPEALRQSLEYFGFFVAVKYVGRPNDLIAVLQGEFVLDPDCIILSCHGEDGAIIMPELGADVYDEREPRGNMTAADIEKHLQLHGKLILNLGCTTGATALATVFSKQNTYIASADYTEGNAALYFAISLFYELSKDGVSIEDAYEKAMGTDNETQYFKMFG